MSHNRRVGGTAVDPEKCNTIDYYSFARCAPWCSPLDEQKG